MENNKSKERIDFAALGIIIGALFVILSIIWITMSSISKKEMSGEDITWVG